MPTNLDDLFDRAVASAPPEPHHAADITRLTHQYQDLFRQLGQRYRHSRYIPIRNHDLDATLSTIGTYIRQEIQ